MTPDPHTIQLLPDGWHDLGDGPRVCLLGGRPLVVHRTPGDPDKPPAPSFDGIRDSIEGLTGWYVADIEWRHGWTSAWGVVASVARRYHGFRHEDKRSIPFDSCGAPDDICTRAGLSAYSLTGSLTAAWGIHSRGAGVVWCSGSARGGGVLAVVEVLGSEVVLGRLLRAGLLDPARPGLTP